MTIRFEPVELMPDRWWFCAVEPATRRLWEVGGCAPKTKCLYCSGTGGDENGDCPRCEGACSVRVLAPCAGHPNALDAFLHWAMWLAETAESTQARTYNLCAVHTCGQPTARQVRLQVGGRKVAMCSRHAEKDFLVEFLLRNESLSRTPV